MTSCDSFAQSLLHTRVYIEPIIGDGIQLQQKLKAIIANRQAAITRQKLQSGIAIAAAGLDQGVDPNLPLSREEV